MLGSSARLEVLREPVVGFSKWKRAGIADCHNILLFVKLSTSNLFAPSKMSNTLVDLPYIALVS